MLKWLPKSAHHYTINRTSDLQITTWHNSWQTKVCSNSSHIFSSRSSTLVKRQRQNSSNNTVRSKAVRIDQVRSLQLGEGMVDLVVSQTLWTKRTLYLPMPTLGTLM